MRKPTQPCVKARYPWALLGIPPAQVLILYVECEEIPRASLYLKNTVPGTCVASAECVESWRKSAQKKRHRSRSQIRLRHGSIAATSGERRRRDGLEL
jgi:hypothetical protein